MRAYLMWDDRRVSDVLHIERLLSTPHFFPNSMHLGNIIKKPEIKSRFFARDHLNPMLLAAGRRDSGPLGLSFTMAQETAMGAQLAHLVSAPNA